MSPKRYYYEGKKVSKVTHYRKWKRNLGILNQMNNSTPCHNNIETRTASASSSDDFSPPSTSTIDDSSSDVERLELALQAVRNGMKVKLQHT